jgi:hypothetical protein
MKTSGIPNFERFFRQAAGLDVDKDDLKRYSEFVNSKLYDLLLMAIPSAKWNGRDIIEPWDLPITKGLEESIHRFEKLDADVEIQPFLEYMAARPQLEFDYSEETIERIPSVGGGISYALANSFKIVDPTLVNPSSEHWERAFQVFNLLL